LTHTERDKFNFQRVCLLNSKNKKEATTYFNKVVNSQEYGSQAKYYLGFMACEGMITRKPPSILTPFLEKKIQRETLLSSRYDFKLGNFQKQSNLVRRQWQNLMKSPN
jgi:hypothetical protein